MAKDIFYYVRCKKDQRAPLQVWVPHLAIINSTCSTCGARTGYDQETGHYDLFEVVLSKHPREDYDEFWQRANALVNADPEKYRVDKHSDRANIIKARKTKVWKEYSNINYQRTLQPSPWR